MSKKVILIVLLFIFKNGIAQIEKQKIQSVLNKNATTKNLSLQDVSDWNIVGETSSTSTKITNYTIVQQYKGIEIFDTQSSIWIKDNEVINYELRFKPNVAALTNSNQPIINLIVALQKAYQNVAISSNPNFSVIETKENNSIYLNDGIQEDNIIAKKVYFELNSSNLKLGWSFLFYAPNEHHYWNIVVDSQNSEILYKKDLTLSCSFDDKNSKEPLESNYSFENIIFSTKKNLVATATPGTYRVIPFNYISPKHHAFDLITTTGDPIASPNGWHNGNTLTGTNPTYIYTYSRGNNVYAQEDADGNNGAGTKPDGGATLTFDYAYGGTSAQPLTYVNAAITNLFYMNNIMHDVWYHYGFNEANGNFQLNNLGRGGVNTITGDAVFADAQDGYLNATPTLNNANFSTAQDGSRPRMQMYLWNSGANGTYLYADSDFDNGVIGHEYGHGISNRLIGGGISTCMNNEEQMGEGWSDWFGLMMQLKTGDSGVAKRPIGTYVSNQANTGPGIRSKPYSTNLAYNNLKLSNSNQTEPHNRGEVWAATLWDLTWAYIGKYGFDPDIYYGTGGNNKVMQLVIDALKLQTCNTSSFISSRDNIIAADQATTGGQDYCLITEVFRRRGMGLNASSGLATSATDQVADYTAFPAGPNCVTMSVNYFETKDMIRVYPNPSEGIFSVRVNNFVGKLNLEVSDINGRSIYKENNCDFNLEKSIDISSFQAGIYLVKVSGDDLNYVQKIIKR